MKLRKLIAGFAAAAVAVSAMVVSAAADGKLFEYTLTDGVAFVDTYGAFMIAIAEADRPNVASVTANVSAPFANGCIGANVNGAWTTNGYEVSGANTATLTCDGGLESDVQLQVWWANAGTLSVDSVSVVDAEGNAIAYEFSAPNMGTEPPEVTLKPVTPEVTEVVNGYLMQFEVISNFNDDLGGAQNFAIPTDGIDPTKIGTVIANITTTSNYFKGIIGANVDGSWSQGNDVFEFSSTSGSFSRDFTGTVESPQIQIWWANPGVTTLQSVTIYDTEGNPLKHLVSGGLPAQEPEDIDDGSIVRVKVVAPEDEADPNNYGEYVNKSAYVSTAGFDTSLIAKVGVTVSTDSYVTGCVTADSGYGSLELEGPATQEFFWTPEATITNLIQVQLWYAKTGVSRITAVTLYKADGSVLNSIETSEKAPFGPDTNDGISKDAPAVSDKTDATSLYGDRASSSGKPINNTYLIPVDSELDYSKIAKVTARIETTDYVNGAMGANIDGTWSQNNFEVTSPGTTVTWTLPGAISDSDSLQIQFWWLNAGSFQLKSVTFYDKDGNEVKKLAAEAGDDTADADATEEPTEEDKTEDTDKEEEDTDSEVDADVDADNGGALAPYYSNGVVYLRTDDGSPAFCDDSGVKLTDVYGIRVYAKFKAEEVADEACWIGGGIGSNSNSTGWAQVEWGRNGAKPIDIDFENGVIEWISDSPIFAADDEYAQLWIQTWGGTVEFEDVELLGKDGIVIAATYASDSDAEIDVDEATDEDIVTDEEANPNTGVALAVVPALVAAAAIVVSKKRK